MTDKEILLKVIEEMKAAYFARAGRHAIIEYNEKEKNCGV